MKEITPGRLSLTLAEPADLKLESIKGVGAKSAAKLIERGITDQLELLLFTPRKYYKCAHHYPGPQLKAERRGRAEFYAPIIQVKKPAPNTRQPVDVTLDHQGQWFKLLWFNMGRASFVRELEVGRWMRVSGEIGYDRTVPTMLHPEFEIIGDGPPAMVLEPRMSVGAVYPSIEGFGDAKMRKAIRYAFDALAPKLGDVVPREVLEARGLPGIAQALATIHMLLDSDDADGFQEALTAARSRLVYEEFYTLQAKLARDYAAARAQAMAPACTDRSKGRAAVRGLPFKLTGDQRAALATIADDLAQTFPMRRLLQGDVGSGKTVVALTAAAIAAGSGYQSALMAPTEILARQHLARAREFLRPHGVKLGFLGGSLGAGERRDTLKMIARGEYDLVVGTHSLFSDDVVFKDLGLVLVDEQHKFGVEQREALRDKGGDPHLLSMTATPIPRSLAHSVFGDMDLTVIREKPPGRQPVRTVLRDREVAPKVYRYVRSRIEEQGEQAYFVYPMVEASEASPHLKNVVEMHAELSEGPLAGLGVGLLHGKLDPAEKDRVMEEFSAGRLHALCATTVIEVGVDVPNATLMVIESPEVFGLSQLHQLRGRVGRGDAASMCVLLAGERLTDIAAERLVSFQATEDGFVLAEADLRLRGPGQFLGVRQAGHAEFRFGDLTRDADLLAQAREDARRVVLRPRRDEG
jgi:ATP-dependent DNA helicase RecG